MAVPDGAPTVEIRSPPAGIDPLIDWFDRVCHRLVLLEAYPLEDVERAVATIDRALRAHIENSRGAPSASPDTPSGLDLAAHLQDDHVRYEGSLEQLSWVLAVVQREDHGGHRQALGQYGRLLAESLRRHREEERGRGSFRAGKR